MKLCCSAASYYFYFALKNGWVLNKDISFIKFTKYSLNMVQCDSSSSSLKRGHIMQLAKHMCQAKSLPLDIAGARDTFK
jgi:hypothetical protein